jgi:O-methyltransferase
VLKLIQQLDVGDVRILKGIFPDKFVDAMGNSIFSFVHVDVDVNRSARDIMSFAWPRLSVGGLVVFDDFGFDTCDGIAQLISNYRGNRDKVILHNLNGHAVIVKIS